MMPAADARKESDSRQVEAKRQRAAERAAAVLESDRKELVKVATRLKTPQTERDLRGNVSFQGQRFKRAIASLADDGTLEAADIEKANKHTYPGWKLRGTSTEETKPAEETKPSESTDQNKPLDTTG
jgi:hypothetical protein